MHIRNLSARLFQRTLGLFLILSLFLIPSLGFANHSKKFKYELAIGAIFRDEAPYLKEWIEYHLLVGVEHFYLYNNLSSDDYKKVLAPYIKQGIVEIKDWSYAYTDIGRWAPIQCSAYNEILQKAKGKTKWLAIIDTDEFIVPLKKNHLPTLLADYDNFGALALNWQMFGTSHVPQIPDNKLLVETLLFKAPVDFAENIHVKCIVRPECIKVCGSPHCCELKSGFAQVNTDKKPFTGPYSPYVAADQIVIQHYWTRDDNYLHLTKMARRNSWQEGADGVLQRASQLNQVEDRSIMRFVPQLRKRVYG